MTFSELDVVVVPFPFTDRAEAKRRPALVVSSNEFNSQHRQTILAMITTAESADWPSDILIQDWKAAGLSVACTVRLKLFTLDNGLVVRRLGKLSERDRRAAKRALGKFLV